MMRSVGEFTLLKQLCADEEKKSYLAEHATLKTPYVVQILEQEVSSSLEPSSCANLVLCHNVQSLEGFIFSASKLETDNLLTSLEEYVNSTAELLDEAKLIDILHQMVSYLELYYKTPRVKAFGLKLENCFIDASGHLVLIDHAHAPSINTTPEDGSIIALGKIAYFLMTKEWPEGYFPLPSEINLKLDKKWDELIKSCLHHRRECRIASFKELLSILERYKNQPLKPIVKPSEVERPAFEPNPGQIFQQELLVAKYAPEEKQIQHITPLITEMIVIPAGEYYRGSLSGARDEMPRHKIYLSAFALDIYPVTNEQFIRFLEVMGGEKDAQNNDMIRLKESRLKRIGGKLVIESGYAKHPVVGISWHGAVAYAKWVGKRLPTEAEWEIAASSLKGDIYPTGESLEKGMANFFSSDTSAVMSYPPSALGLYDMAGNVYEWCQDWYGYNYYEASLQEPSNPKGPQQGVYRVLRGGCWKSLKEDLRVSYRHRNNPFALNSTYGFRLAADVQ